MREYFEDLSKSMSLKERVYTILKERIISGDLKPGEHLNELELSAAMNISRGPIREALNMLEKEGFAVIIPRKGAVVASVTAEDVKNVWEMRRLLEPYAAVQSLDKFTDKDIQSLESKMKAVSMKPDDFSLYMESDLELHELLHKYVRNKLLKDTLIMVRQHSLRLRYYSEDNSVFRKEVIQVVSKEHSDILEAIKECNEQKVIDAISRHLINSENRTLRALNSD
jgi:DNA-binding GntR family transcriptional regulator